MSADKQKKKERAFKFLRERRRWIKHDAPQSFYFTGPADANIRWLVRKGFATVKRMARSGFGRGRNVFTEVDPNYDGPAY